MFDFIWILENIVELNFLPWLMGSVGLYGVVCWVYKIIYFKKDN